LNRLKVSLKDAVEQLSCKNMEVVMKLRGRGIISRLLAVANAANYRIQLEFKAAESRDNKRARYRLIDKMIRCQ
jgi:hypothetical protein